MTTLFTINQSWHNQIWLYEQLAFASSGDTLLLFEDAVYALANELTLASFLAKCDALSISVKALHDDLSLRGVESVYPSVELVDYTGFVELVTQNDKQVAW